MKQVVIFLAVYFLALTACKKSKIEIAAGAPACIRMEIEKNASDPNWLIGKVDEYRFQDKTVYAFSPDEKIIADASTRVSDSACKTICNVGGFGGPDIVLCNGQNFYQNAVLVRNIWKKR
jgi:hypothetical protein